MATTRSSAKGRDRLRTPVRWLEQPDDEGPYTTSKRFRSSPELDAAITDASKYLGLTESEVIRAGIRMVDRIVRRQRHGALLVDMTDIPGDDAHFELR